MNIKKQLHKIANYYDVLSKENARLNDLIDEYIQERDYLDGRCAALENDLVLLEVSEMLKKTQARVQELDKQTEAAGDLLESISMWLWKIQGLQPEPMWVDQFKSVCNLFEPPQQPESEEE